MGAMSTLQDESIRSAAARALECAEGSRRRAAAILDVGRGRLDRILDDGADGSAGQDPDSPGEGLSLEKCPEPAD